jgi:hypothetical protein
MEATPLFYVEASGQVLLRKIKGIIYWEEGILSIQVFPPYFARLFWTVGGHSRVLLRLEASSTIHLVNYSLSITGKKWGLEFEAGGQAIMFCFSSETRQQHWWTCGNNTIMKLKAWRDIILQYEIIGIQFVNCASENASPANYQALCEFCDSLLLSKPHFLSRTLLLAVQRLVLNSSEVAQILLERRDFGEILQQNLILGSGGFSVVSKGRMEVSGTMIDVAVKKIDTEGHPCVSPFELGALRRELFILKMVKHPTLLAYHGYLYHEPHYYIITELASCNLMNFIELSASSGGLAWEVKVHIVREICTAVHTLHQLDIAHRDLKTENVFLVIISFYNM